MPKGLLHLVFPLKMTTLQRLELRYWTDEVLDALVEKMLFGKAVANDPHAPIHQELMLRAALYDVWDAQVQSAVQAMHHYSILGSLFGGPTIAEVPKIMEVLGHALSGPAIAKGIATVAKEAIAQGFQKGKDTVNHDFSQAKKRLVRKSDLMFGAVFGLTEQHALDALTQQLMIAAGSFWDDQLQDSIKTEVEGFFSGNLTRDELSEKLMAMVNTRLVASDAGTLAKSYFDNLSVHIVNSSRNIGSTYQLKSLGVTQYTLYNPRDNRTSPICQAVTNGQVFEMAHAEDTVTAKLQARSTDDLKASVPFLTPDTASTAKGPVPPLHWPKCRTRIHGVF
jgi:hypothetical protein